MAADALEPSVAGASAIMVLTVQDREVPVFHEEGLQIPAPSVYREMIKNIFCFLK